MTTKTTTDGATTPVAIQHPAEALETVLQGARIADPVISGPDGKQYAFVPKDFTLSPISDETRLPTYPGQQVTVDDRQSLIDYTNRFSDGRSIIIADFDSLMITAHLDWHPHNQHEDAGTSGPQKHRVTLKLRESEEFARWNNFANKLHPQEDFARFLEENASDIQTPDPATMIEISRDFEATVGQTYKASTRLDNGDRRMIFESDTRAKNEIVVPQKFTLLIPIYNGEEPDTLTALFRWRAQGGGVAFAFEWHRVEYQRRAHFQQIAMAAAEATGLPYFMGRKTA